MADYLPIIFTSLHILAVLFALIAANLLMGDKKNTGLKVFYAFGMLCFLASDAYWIVYDYMNPDVRMPFAVNEVGEAAFFLLMASCLRLLIKGSPDRTVSGAAAEAGDAQSLRDPYRDARLQAVLTAVFVLAQMVLWIIWTREWIQDTLGGLPIAYFFCLCAVYAKQTDSFSKREWSLLAGSSFLAVAVNFAALAVERGPVYDGMMTAAFAVLAAVAAWLAYRVLQLLLSGEAPLSCMALSFVFMAWTVSAMYMSEGFAYIYFEAMNLISVIFTALSLRKAAMQYDIC